MINQTNKRLLTLMSEQTSAQIEDIINHALGRFLLSARDSGVFSDPNYKPELRQKIKKRPNLPATKKLREMNIGESLQVHVKDLTACRVRANRSGFRIQCVKTGDQVIITRIS